MKDKLFNSIKVLSYFLWEYTNYDNTLKLWCCAEDIVCFLAENNIKTKENFMAIIYSDKTSEEYKEFIRNISYKIFDYTDIEDNEKNWFIAEKFIKNYECIDACFTAIEVFSKIEKNDSIYKSIRSENAREYISYKL